MTDLSGDRDGDVRPLTASWPPLAVVPLSLRALRYLLRVTLPQPTLDLTAALAWPAYQQQRQVAAYRSYRSHRSHRTRVLGQLAHPGLPARSKSRCRASIPSALLSCP
jgi:hypothetical protein